MMNQQETKNCQNCKTEFQIELEDFTFYEKMQVPPPTFCPQCRLVRRLVHYNKRTLYKRECQLCGKSTFGMYDRSNPVTVYCNTCWWSDRWDPMEYGMEYDPSRPFLAQVKELLGKVPWMALGVNQPTIVNSDYCNAAGGLRNCYLMFYADFVEDSYYCDTMVNAKDCFDCFLTGYSQGCFECVNVTKCYRAYFSTDCDNSYDIYFSKNLVGCSDCFGCVNLRKKEYCILNKQYTKEEYEKLVPKIIEEMKKNAYIDSRGHVYAYGEFYPSDFSPFAYNESIAQEFFPLTQAEAETQKLKWSNAEEKTYHITKNSADLPQSIKDTDDSILREVVACEHKGSCSQQCSTAFRIIPQELSLYRKMSFALPRLCPNCRHYERLKRSNPVKLFHRRCTCAGAESRNGVYQNAVEHVHAADHCPNEFETSFAPERPEIVYCAECYQSEVA